MRKVQQNGIVFLFLFLNARQLESSTRQLIQTLGLTHANTFYLLIGTLTLLLFFFFLLRTPVRVLVKKTKKKETESTACSLLTVQKSYTQKLQSLCLYCVNGNVSVWLWRTNAQKPLLLFSRCGAANCSAFSTPHTQFSGTQLSWDEIILLHNHFIYCTFLRKKIKNWK